jgi:hypothetical protein
LGAACGALSGCYDAVEGKERVQPDDEDPQQDGSSSGMPPTAGATAPAEPPQTEPGDPPDDVPGDPEPSAPTADGATSFQGEPGFTFAQSGQIVGDLDGDGFDDFVLFAFLGNAVDLSPPAGVAYVFYGQRELPRVMDVARADAVLRGAGFALPIPEFNAGASGDLDGDGLADLVIGGVDGAHFVFGSEQRLAGEHELADVSVRWSVPAMPMPMTGWPVRVAAAGDVNGDGLSDVMLTLNTGEFVMEFENGTSSSLIDSAFLVLGREDEWPSGMFEPDWAEAAFVVDEAMYGGCAMYGAADLNGDGSNDLVLQVESSRRLLPGGDGAFTGTVQAVQAGASLDLPTVALRALPDLDGDGSQEVAWTDGLGDDRLFVTFGRSDLDPIELLEPDFFVQAQGMVLPATSATDFDGDGTQDLMVVAGGAGTAFGVYLLAAESLRGVDEVRLKDARLVLALPEDGSGLGQPMGMAIDTGGDVNGDGIDDLLITTATPDAMGVPIPAVWLLPGGTELTAR